MKISDAFRIVHEIHDKKDGIHVKSWVSGPFIDYGLVETVIDHDNKTPHNRSIEVAIRDHDSRIVGYVDGFNLVDEVSHDDPDE